MTIPPRAGRVRLEFRKARSAGLAQITGDFINGIGQNAKNSESRSIARIGPLN